MRPATAETDHAGQRYPFAQPFPSRPWRTNVPDIIPFAVDENADGA
jgi:hypothetical protein